MMIFGPFSTKGRTKGEFGAHFYGYATDYPDDWFAQSVSVDGVNFYGWQYRPTNGKWLWMPLLFHEVPTLGSVLNKDKVWVAFVFHSDGDAKRTQGQFVDDAKIRLWPYNPTPMDAPTAPYVSGHYEDRIEIQSRWVSGLTHYRFLRKGPGESDFKVISGWQEDDDFVDYDVESGVEYQYKTQVAESPTGTRASAASAAAAGRRKMAPPREIHAYYHGSTDYIRVYWYNDNPNAKFYKLFRCDGSNPDDLETYASITEWINKTAFDDTTAVPGKKYYYRVKGAVNVNGDGESHHSDYAREIGRAHV
mgnify:CR=1 FL=1